MQRAIATVSVAGTLPEKLRAIADAGFDAVELFAPDLARYSGTPEEVAGLARDAGLEIALFQPLRDIEGAPRAQWPASLVHVRQALETTRALGCRQMLLCSNTDSASSSSREQQIDDLAQVAALAQAYEVKIGFEALAWGQHIAHYRQAWDRVKAVNSPALGLVLDSFHILALGDTLMLDEIPLAKIFFVQLADAPHKALPVEEWSRHYRCYPGEGELPLTPFVRTLADKGYVGPWSLEIFSDRWQHAPAADSARAGYRGLDWVQARLSQR